MLDDATLDIVLHELDTITDLTAYLSKKERLIRSGRLIVAGGEKDLVAYYMTHTIVPDGQPFVLSELEEGVRHMAVVPRRLRRMLGDGILDALRKGTKADRFTRGFLPRPTDPEQDAGFFFYDIIGSCLQAKPRI